MKVLVHSIRSCYLANLRVEIRNDKNTGWMNFVIREKYSTVRTNNELIFHELIVLPHQALIADSRTASATVCIKIEFKQEYIQIKCKASPSFVSSKRHKKKYCATHRMRVADARDIFGRRAIFDCECGLVD